MASNFWSRDKRSRISDILSEYDMTVMDYPQQYEGCPLLQLEMIHHFLKSCENWLASACIHVGQTAFVSQNIHWRAEDTRNGLQAGSQGIYTAVLSLESPAFTFEISALYNKTKRWFRMASY
jgi:hypothetical protein